jgi:hypothetical protein
VEALNVSHCHLGDQEDTEALVASLGLMPSLRLLAFSSKDFSGTTGTAGTARSTLQQALEQVPCTIFYTV